MALARFRKNIALPGYTIAACIVSLGGFLNGYDTGSIGAITEMPAYLKTIGVLSPTMRGFTVSSIMLAGCIPSLFAGQLADRLGRVKIVILGSLLFAIGAVLEGAALHLPMFLAGRVLCGIGEGFWISTICVYITEIAPSARRGMLVSVPQLMCTTGICLGYFTCYGASRMKGTIAWRIPFIIQAAVATIFSIGCLFLPESPRWLILHNQQEKAMREIDRLDFSRVEAEKDVLRPAEQAPADVSLFEGLRMIFRRNYRARTILALFILGMVQLSGIDGVLFYAPTLMAQAGLPSQTASFLASGVSAILMLLITIPAFLLADRWGRRTSVISGGIGLSSCMLIIGSLYAAGAVHPYGAARWVVVVLIFAFALTYCVTWGVVSKIYASEIQPAHTRATANCLAQGLNFFANWLVAFCTPIFLSKSAFGGYFLFGFLSLATVVVLAAVMPETRGVSLESMQDAFRSGPMMKSWAHQLRTMFSRNTPPSTPSSASSEIMASGALPAGRNGSESDGIELGSMESSMPTSQVDLPVPLRVASAI